MYLKRIESVGFKSFAERIQIEFVKGMTAIIGPNGSGKSNVTDAIRWVLGEQSVKSLRGYKMEDVIFQGSDTRNPLNVAEVTIVLDNSKQVLPLDYNEINITRRVYRSGDSEFYINKQSCRLKDIIDLFIDSGLGQESFSIISQGKVEEVLSSKAEERRAIFEEAAGVLKYKQRKKKSEYKLAETQENLNRIEDIIYEIEQQKEPLAKQAEIAKIFNKKRELLKEQEISLLVTEIEQLHTEWESLLKELENEKEAEIKLKTTIQGKEAELESDRQKIIVLDEKIEKLQASLLKKTQQVEQYEGKKQVLHERLKHFTENKSKLEQEQISKEAKVKEIREMLRHERERLDELQENKAETNEKIKKVKEKLTNVNDNLIHKIEKQKTLYIEQLSEQAVKRNERDSIKEQFNQLMVKKEERQNKFQQLIEDRESLEVEQDEKDRLYQQAKETCDKLEEELLTDRDILHEEQDKFDALQHNLYKGYEQIATLKSRKETLEEMKEDFQGFHYGVKQVLKARENQTLKNIHGAVIELVDIPEQYITAMETVLGNQAQHIVVDTEQVAREAIAWLKKTNNGRATFLPLTSIKARFISSETKAKLKQHKGFIGIASEVIKTKGTHQKVIDHLMGHVIIAQTLQDANELARICQHRNRIVTMEGDVVNPGGSMSGGAKTKKNQTLFTREKDLQKLTETLVSFEDKASKSANALNEKKAEIEKLQNKIKVMEQDLVKKKHQLDDSLSSLRQVEMKLESKNDRLLIYDRDNKQFIQEKVEIEERSNQLLRELKSIDVTINDIQMTIEKLTKEEDTSRENENKWKEDFQGLQIIQAEEEERIRNQSEKVMNIEQEMTNELKELEYYTQELNQLLALRKAEETKDTIDHDIEKEKATLEQTEETIQQKRKERLDRTKSISDQERELKEENKKHHEFVKKIQEKEVKVNRIDVDLENRLTHLQTEYMITFEKARQSYKKVSSISAAKKRVQSITEEINQLGRVNLGSIEEYDRILERFTFLTEQKDDLVEAKQTLFSIIAEMDKVMKERFKTTFDQIKNEFSTVFKELFGGGIAELTLTDPENILETGIDIIAQPPGKKLQHIGLLSGGERALTAIALLFAILRVRPVPFCVLDEVEASLDEANVIRFAKYLKLHSDDTQFIVITHRKGTMEEADVLYGVTMQESGVSRLVSVQLEERDTLITT